MCKAAGWKKWRTEQSDKETRFKGYERVPAGSDPICSCAPEAVQLTSAKPGHSTPTPAPGIGLFVRAEP